MLVKRLVFNSCCYPLDPLFFPCIYAPGYEIMKNWIEDGSGSSWSAGLMRLLQYRIAVLWGMNESSVDKMRYKSRETETFLGLSLHSVFILRFREVWRLSN